MDAKNKAEFINSVIHKTEEHNSDTETAQAAAGTSLPEAADDVFAAGLPAWDLVPPQVVVRRIRRS